MSSGAAGVRPARTAGGRSADRRSWEVGRSEGGWGGAGRAQAGLLGAQDVATWSHFLFPPLPRPWPCLVLAAVPGTGRVTDCSSGNITSYHATAAGLREASDRERLHTAPVAQYFPAFTRPRVQVQADDEVQSPVRSGAGETQIVRHWLGWAGLGWAGLGWLAPLSAVSWPRGAASPASCQLCCAAPLRTAATADKASRNYGLCPLLASVRA